MTHEQLMELDEDELKRRLKNQFQLEDDEIGVMFKTKEDLVTGYLERIKLVKKRRNKKEEALLGYELGDDSYVPTGESSKEADALVAKERTEELETSIKKTGAKVTTKDIDDALAALNDPEPTEPKKKPAKKSKK